VSGVLILGEAPGPGGGHDILAGRIGRLLCAAAGIPGYADLARLARLENLLDCYPGSAWKGSAFPRDAARAAAVLRVPRMSGTVLLLGHRVAAAFGVRAAYFTWGRIGRARAAVFPHPSGVNRWWNDRENRRLAAAFLREVLAQKKIDAACRRSSL
jgi:hypothetical protein